MLRDKSLCDQLLRCFHDPAEGPLRIQSPSPPDHTVFHDSFKRRLLPLGLLHRHYIIMRHQHHRLIRCFSLPVIQHTVYADELPRTFLMHPGIKLREQILEFLKLRLIDQAVVIVRNRPAADHLYHIIYNPVAAQIDLFP